MRDQQTEVLKRSAVRLLTATLLLCVLTTRATGDQIEPSGWETPKRFEQLAPHPRLFVSQEQRNRAIAGRGEAYAALYETVETAANAAMKDADNPLSTLSIWNRAIRMQERVMSLIVQWHLTRDRRFLDAALNDIASIKGWMSKNELRLVEGQLSSCLAVVYDLLYDDLTQEQRDGLIKLAREHFILPFLRSTGPGNRSERIPGERRMWWQGMMSNWNPVSISGGGMLALAMYEHIPEAQTVIDRVNASYQGIFNQLQETQGGWVEGLGYWNWAINYMSQFLISYERATGEQHAGFRSPGFRKTLTLGTYFVAHGEACGFGNNQHGGFSPSLAAAAEQLNDTEALAKLMEYWQQRENVARIKAEKSAAAAGKAPEPWRRGGGAYELLLRPDDPVLALPPRKNIVQTFPKRWSMIADQWPDSTFYAAVRGGELGGHHTHQDLLSWHGVVGIERMILNITASDYYNTVWQGRAHEVYEKGSASKNTLFIGGLSAYIGQQRGGRPAMAVESHFQLPSGPALRLDATTAYWLTRAEPTLVCRLFTVIDDKALLVLDRIITNGAHPVEARAFTDKETVFGKQDVLIKGQFETARMTFASDAPAVLRQATAVLTDGHRTPPTMIRWQTHNQTANLTFASLLTRGEAPVDLKLERTNDAITVKISSEDWTREVRLNPRLEPIQTE